MERNGDYLFSGSYRLYRKWEVETVKIGENIRRIRNEKGLQQRYVARKAGITQSMLSQIEKGGKNLTLQKGKAIADVLGCTLEELLE